MTRSHTKGFHGRGFEQKVAKEAKTDLDWVYGLIIH